jgi:hypothetical protein
MYQYLDEKQKKQFFLAVVGVLALLAIFILVQAVIGVKQFSYVGKDNSQTNIITVSGTGFVMAVPDIAEFSFSVVADAVQVSDAQNSAATKTNAIIAALKTMGVADADIQTTGYNSYPTYTYQNAVCSPSPILSPMISGTSGSSVSSAIYCPPSKQTLTGYEVSETLDVKIRNMDNAGTALSKVGSLGATNISGLSFVVDNLDAVQTQARDKAITDAKTKAAHLAQVLGVSLNHIVNFNDNGVEPIYKGNVMSLAASVSGAGTVTPQIQTGQNKVTSDVTISYEVN